MEHFYWKTLLHVPKSKIQIYSAEIKFWRAFAWLHIIRGFGLYYINKQ